VVYQGNRNDDNLTEEPRNKLSVKRPVYDCIKCDGYDMSCKDYKALTPDYVSYCIAYKRIGVHAKGGLEEIITTIGGRSHADTKTKERRNI
jgi:hypothetical protein